MTNAVLMNGNVSPPHISFFEDSTEDREASLKDGQARFKTVYVIRVRQAGSKDGIEKNAEEWLEHVERIKQFPDEWIVKFRAMFEAFKKGQEPTPFGTSVKLWPAVSKAQAQTLVAAGVLTVEDLATANEATLMRIGIGARNLQNQARAWRDTAQATGVVANELDALRVKDAQKDDTIADLRARIDELAAELRGSKKKKTATEDDFLATGT